MCIESESEEPWSKGGTGSHSVCLEHPLWGLAGGQRCGLRAWGRSGEPSRPCQGAWISPKDSVKSWKGRSDFVGLFIYSGHFMELVFFPTMSNWNTGSPEEMVKTL